MKTIRQAPRKLGPNRKEIARKAPKRDRNFAQSRDIREDRGQRQMKEAGSRRTFVSPLQ